MPQFESVEEIRHVQPGEFGTLIPSWNTGLRLRERPSATAVTGTVVRPGQMLEVLAAQDKHLEVRLVSDGVTGWLPEHVVAPWPRS
jgi:hypothetical protein